MHIVRNQVLLWLGPSLGELGRRVMIRTILLGFLILALPIQPAWSADDKGPVNLLRLPAAKLEASTLPAAEWGGLKALIDDDPATFARMPSEGGVVDVVYGFGGAMVAPQRLVVRLPREQPADTKTARVEVLVSTLSAYGGFWSLRSDPLQSTANVQEFAFPPTGARWIMLRFTPAAKAKAVAVAEVAVLGYEGPPLSRYAFQEAPAKAFDVLARLQKSSSLDVTISPDEAALFADVKDGKFTKWSFAEAALLASGVIDPGKRKEYLNQLDALEAKARKALAGAKTPKEKGEKLLTWLHAKDGPLAKGYVARQTDLPVILDTATFNCVSSALLYNVLGRRLGLDLRAIEVPDHAFSILYDGTNNADVETTTSSGFNPARDQAAQQQFEKETGFRYIPDSHRDQRREIGEAGLVAIVYYNHGVTLTDQKRNHEALLAYFRAMSLDQEFNSAVKNALAVLANWSLELAGAGKFEAAINVLSTGVELAPKDARLVHNRKVIWGDWAMAAAKAGKEEEALDILRRASKEVPDGNFPVMQAWIYIRRGEELVSAGQWDKALAAAQQGLQKIDKGPQDELRRWQSGAAGRWVNGLVDEAKHEDALAVLERHQKAVASEAEARSLFIFVFDSWARKYTRTRQWDEAIGVFDKGLERIPDSDILKTNLVYNMQEWVRDAYKSSGQEKAKAVLFGLRQRYPSLAAVDGIAQAHVQRVVAELRDAGKYAEGLAAIDANKDLLKNSNSAMGLVYSVYDRWAGSFTDKKDWQGATDIYAKALKSYPKDGHLRNNAIATWNSWASTRMDAKDWAGAIKLYENGLMQFPDSGVLKNNLAYCKEQLKKG
jgi:tetratricopeptide (TPR) repeat protein